MGESPFPNLLMWGRIVLRGIGQVIFQDHAGTGLLFLAGIAVASPVMAAGALIGAVVGPALARALRYDRKEVEDGVYGFNPTLVGIAYGFKLRNEARVALSFSWTRSQVVRSPGRMAHGSYARSVAMSAS